MSETGKILVIDDEETMRDSCRLALSREGYRVSLAVNGSDGLAKLRADTPDLALIDLKMPGVDGMQVLKEMREIDPTIVPIVITGYATVDTAIDAFKLGAYDFLPKPFSPDELRIVVGRGVERRRLHRESLALQEQKQRIQKVFVAMVSHQLRSPLANIQQDLEVLTGGLVGGLSEQQMKMLGRMKGQVGRLLSLTADWLNLSRIESGKLAESFELLPLMQVVGEVAETVRPQSEARRIRLAVTGPERAMVRGDRQALRQMLFNLVDNAIKYNREGGSIDIAVEDRGPETMVRVSDTGPGIEAKEVPLVFDEFYRSASGRGREEGGSGLGLPIARKIAEAHSGTITLESVPGQGSTFTVSLPKQ